MNKVTEFDIVLLQCILPSDFENFSFQGTLWNETSCYQVSAKNYSNGWIRLNVEGQTYKFGEN